MTILLFHYTNLSTLNRHESRIRDIDGVESVELSDNPSSYVLSLRISIPDDSGDDTVQALESVRQEAARMFHVPVPFRLELRDLDPEVLSNVLNEYTRSQNGRN